MRSLDNEGGQPGKPIITFDLTGLSRAVAAVTIGMVHTVERAMVGPERVPTARGNAWAAICADKERAIRRDEIRRMVATLATARPDDGGPATGPAAPPPAVGATTANARTAVGSTPSPTPAAGA